MLYAPRLTVQCTTQAGRPSQPEPIIRKKSGSCSDLGAQLYQMHGLSNSDYFKSIVRSSPTNFKLSLG